jgi:probable O-glycosylation ligase (exosortase A-associated)
MRVIFVVTIIVVGGLSALRGPFQALLFYLWYAYFRPEQWVWSDFVSPLNLSFVTGAWLLISSALEIHKFRWSRITTMIGLIAVQSTISMLASEHPDWSTPYWIEFMKVLAVSLLIGFVVSSEERFRATLLVIVYSLGLEAAKQGWAQFILHPGAPNTNPHPVLGDNNGVAMGMMMLIPLSLALVRTSSRRWEKRIHMFFAAGFLYRGLSTYSRGGFIAAAAVGALIFWQSPRKIRTFAGIGVLALAVGAVMPDSFWQRMQTISASADERDASAQGRLAFWQTAVLMANAKPLTGVGLNGFSKSYNTYDNSGGAYGEDRAVHSAWFGILAELGYPGLCVLILTVWASFSSCARAKRQALMASGPPSVPIYADALRMSFVAYVAGATFLNGQYSEMFWHFVGLSAALTGITANWAQERRGPNAPLASALMLDQRSSTS